MDGVTILASCSGDQYYFIAVLFSAIAIAVCIFAIISFVDGIPSAGVLLSMFNVLLIITSIVLWQNAINIKEYKVIVDDSVSMNEFNEQYNIIDQEGDIYTVTVKDQN